MVQELGIPTTAIFGALGAAGVFIFMAERGALREKILDNKKSVTELENKIETKIVKLEKANKELSLEELETLNIYIKRCINEVVNSVEFRTDIKETIKQSLLHIERNRSIAEADKMDLFIGKLDDLNNKIDSLKNETKI